MPEDTTTTAPGILRVTIAGEAHAVTAPAMLDFCLREELVCAIGETHRKGGMAYLRACSALVGACTRLGRRAEIDYFAEGCDPLRYGGRVYSWLMAQERRPTKAEIVAAAMAILPGLTAANAPREADVEARTGFSEGDAGASTAPLSG